jgi:hypothetical protein
MEKELIIKVKINSSFNSVVYANPNLEAWNDATNEQRDEYVKERIREFLLENIDELLDNSEIGIELN